MGRDEVVEYLISRLKNRVNKQTTSIIKSKGEKMKTVLVMVLAAFTATQLTGCGADKSDSADSASTAE